MRNRKSIKMHKRKSSKQRSLKRKSTMRRSSKSNKRKSIIQRSRKTNKRKKSLKRSKHIRKTMKRNDSGNWLVDLFGGVDQPKSETRTSRSSTATSVTSSQPSKSRTVSVDSDAVRDFNYYAKAITNADEVITELYRNPERIDDYVTATNNWVKMLADKCVVCHKKKAEYNLAGKKIPAYCEEDKLAGMVNTKETQLINLTLILNNYAGTIFTSYVPSKKIEIPIFKNRSRLSDKPLEYTDEFKKLLAYVREEFIDHEDFFDLKI